MKITNTVRSKASGIILCHPVRKAIENTSVLSSRRNREFIFHNPLSCFQTVDKGIIQSILLFVVVNFHPDRRSARSTLKIAANKSDPNWCICASNAALLRSGELKVPTHKISSQTVLSNAALLKRSFLATFPLLNPGRTVGFVLSLWL